jgi:hypothetical protein
MLASYKKSRAPASMTPYNPMWQSRSMCPWKAPIMVAPCSSPRAPPRLALLLVSRYGKHFLENESVVGSGESGGDTRHFHQGHVGTKGQASSVRETMFMQFFLFWPFEKIFFTNRSPRKLFPYLNPSILAPWVHRMAPKMVAP